ncbi:MAG TPA: helix-turn-helix domain-containing protein [Devosia sp.]|jgi:AcrR family transcriptional regulator|nr:helix-turn-helix domain-containing protein [Devosia sp.]
MARARAFDTDTVLWAAANLFRQRGYRNVTIPDLAEATGLVSGSIYNAFGDKAGLFRAALRHYVTGFVQPRLERHAGEGARLEDLEQLFLSVLEAPLDDGGGCLVNNSIIEFGSADPLAREDLAGTLDLVREGIASVLQRELPPEAVAAATVRLLILYHGVLTLSRSTTPAADMALAVRSEFDALRTQRDALSPSSTSRSQ